ncbi:MAG: S6e family ribosomal protein [Candidatus Pacearchaeota archaeon]
MPFKINIGTKEGKTFHLETESEALIGKKIGEIVQGEDIAETLKGYEFEITGTSDKAGFPGLKEIEGQALKQVLLTYGVGMKKKPRKEGRKGKKTKPKGLRLKKSVRGNTISKDTVQINIKVKKEGSKKLEEIFPEQIKKKEENIGQTTTSTTTPARPAAEKKEEKEVKK